MNIKTTSIKVKETFGEMRNVEQLLLFLLFPLTLQVAPYTWWGAHIIQLIHLIYLIHILHLIHLILLTHPIRLICLSFLVSGFASETRTIVLLDKRSFSLSVKVVVFLFKRRTKQGGSRPKVTPFPSLLYLNPQAAPASAADQK